MPERQTPKPALLKEITIKARTVKEAIDQLTALTLGNRNIQELSILLF